MVFIQVQFLVGLPFNFMKKLFRKIFHRIFPEIDCIYTWKTIRKKYNRKCTKFKYLCTCSYQFRSLYETDGPQIQKLAREFLISSIEFSADNEVAGFGMNLLFLTLSFNEDRDLQKIMVRKAFLDYVINKLENHD